MDYQICGLAFQVDPTKIESLGSRIENQTVSYKILRQKIANMKFYVDWIRVDMEDDGV